MTIGIIGPAQLRERGEAHGLLGTTTLGMPDPQHWVR